MFTSEREAKTKRCQEGFAASPGAARDPAIEYTVVNKPVPLTSMAMGMGAAAAFSSASEPKTAPIFCLGSACMAWRWERPPPANRTSGEDWYEGYCGKAGKQ